MELLIAVVAKSILYLTKYLSLLPTLDLLLYLDCFVQCQQICTYNKNTDDIKINGL